MLQKATAEPGAGRQQPQREAAGVLQSMVGFAEVPALPESERQVCWLAVGGEVHEKTEPGR